MVLAGRALAGIASLALIVWLARDAALIRPESFGAAALAWIVLGLLALLMVRDHEAAKRQRALLDHLSAIEEWRERGR